MTGEPHRGDTFYYRTALDALTNDGEILRSIDVLTQDVGIIGLLSDWPATTTFDANCLTSSSGPWDATEPGYGAWPLRW
jgi:glycerophosphoryl diester phosphodiesterase